MSPRALSVLPLSRTTKIRGMKTGSSVCSNMYKEREQREAGRSDETWRWSSEQTPVMQQDGILQPWRHGL